MIFLTMHMKILTFSEYRKTPIGVGQPLTSYHQERNGKGEEDA
jgi:hypothetical protein